MKQKQKKTPKVQAPAPKLYVATDDVVQLAESVIAEKGLLSTFKPKIGYIMASPYISKTTVAKCLKASKEVALFTEYDYLIELSEDIWNISDENMRRIILHHEILHILPVFKEKKNDWTYKILDHDVKDFYTIIKLYGIDWFDNLKYQITVLRDLNPEMQDSITL